MSMQDEMLATPTVSNSHFPLAEHACSRASALGSLPERVNCESATIVMAATTYERKKQSAAVEARPSHMHSRM